MPLTDLQIKRAKPQVKPYPLSDGNGLSLLVDPNGGKGWRFRYRLAGKARLMSLGFYETVPLAEARQKRDEARKLVSAGINPVEVRKAERQAEKITSENTFEAIAREWHNAKSDRWSLRYREEIITTFEQDIFPYICSGTLNLAT